LSVLRDKKYLALGEETASQSEDTPEDYKDYILSYAMVLKKVSAAAGDNSYRRVGLAQVDYLWMKEATKMIIKLV
jgi:hypothetical protein